MKIDLMNKYHYAQLALPEKSGSKGSIVKLDDDKKQQGYYSGSFTGKGATTTGFLWNFLQKASTFCDKEEVVTSSIIALTLAAVLRPLAIMALPGNKKDKGDKIYASGHSMASGAIGFVFSSILMKPFTNAYDNLKSTISKINEGDYSLISEEKQKNIKRIFNVEQLKDLVQDKKFDAVSRFYKLVPDSLLFGFIKASLTIALIPVILKYVFHIEKGKGTQQKEPQPQQNIEINAMSPQDNEDMEARK